MKPREQSIPMKILLPEAGRLDRILRSVTFPGAEYFSRSTWKKLFELGALTTNQGKKMDPGDQIPAHTEINLWLPSRELGLAPDLNSNLSPIFEDSELGILAFSKPAEVPVYPRFPWERGTFANQIAGTLEHSYGIPAATFAQLGPPPKLEGGLLQRLDTGTSGVSLVALNAKIKQELRICFSEHVVEKTYLAIIIGEWKNKTTEEFSFEFFQNAANRVCVVGAPRTSAAFGNIQGQPTRAASYRIHCLEKNNLFSLVSVTTTGGIRHQVRVALSALGYPLVGDSLYQNSTERAASPAAITFHQLHAWKLRVEARPGLPNTLNIQDNLPASFRYHLDTLGLYYFNEPT